MEDGKIVFQMILAERVIRVSAIYPETVTFVKDYLTEDEREAEIAVCISEADIDFEQMHSDREAEVEGHPKRVWPRPYLETLAVYRKIVEKMPFYETFLFHGSVIAVDGEAYLFTAKSGTGKSTHTRLWREMFGDRCVMINDDKPLLKVTDEGVRAYGTPWNGKHHLGTNASAPLRAVCILERDVDNHIARVDAGEVFPLLMQQTYRPAEGDALMQTLDLLDHLCKKVPIYRLGCTMEPEAAKVSYEGMQEP